MKGNGHTDGKAEGLCQLLVQSDILFLKVLGDLRVNVVSIPDQCIDISGAISDLAVKLVQLAHKLY